MTDTLTPLGNWTQPLRQPTDIERILQVPQIDPEWVAPAMDQYVAKPGAEYRLRPIQNKALYFAAYYPGVLGFVGVGKGKTAICVLIAVILQEFHGIPPNKVLLLIPPEMRNELAKEWHKYGRSWRLPHGLNIMTYAQLSQPESTGRLEMLAPLAIICDEADKLNNLKSDTTGRYVRYMQANPGCRLFAFSGTLVSTSVANYAHHARFALGDNSPLPLEYGALQQFAAALDSRRKGEDKQATAMVGRLQARFGGQTVREGYYRRLASTPGVLVSTESELPAEPIFQPRTFDLPAQVADLYDRLENDWTLPDGTITENALEVQRKLRELSLGFWYQWVWPDDKPDAEWLAARQAWNSLVREHKDGAPPGSDGNALCARLCNAWLWHKHSPKQYPRPALPMPDNMLDAWRQWCAHKHKPTPPTRAVWVDYFAVHDAAQWAAQQPSAALLWTEQEEFGFALSRATGYRFADAGPESNALLADLKRPETLVISRPAHFRGKNLQHLFYRNLYTCPVSNGGWFEQQSGRTCRPGQPNAQVFYDLNVHTPVLYAGLQQARDDARLIAAHNLTQIMCAGKWLRTVGVDVGGGGGVDLSRLRVLPRSWGRNADGTYADAPAGYERHAVDKALESQRAFR